MKKFLFILIALCMSICANAQFYGDSDIHYYVEAGKDARSTLICVIFQGDKAVISGTLSNQPIREKIKNGTLRNYLNTQFSHWKDWHYDDEYSTSVRTTYKFDTKATGTRYAFKKDKSEFKIFSVDSYGEIFSSNKVWSDVWVEIPESELLPKTPNKDFLYE